MKQPLSGAPIAQADSTPYEDLPEVLEPASPTSQNHHESWERETIEEEANEDTVTSINSVKVRFEKSVALKTEHNSAVSINFKAHKNDQKLARIKSTVSHLECKSPALMHCPLYSTYSTWCYVRNQSVQWSE